MREPLTAVDGRHLVLENGDYAEIALRTPEPLAGFERSYVLRTNGWYRIHAPNIGEPLTEILDRVEQEPGAVARLSVARMNEALKLLATEGPR